MNDVVQKIEGRWKGEIPRGSQKIDQKMKLTIQRR
jgi:hypothetical protein